MPHTVLLLDVFAHTKYCATQAAIDVKASHTSFVQFAPRALGFKVLHKAMEKCTS